MTGLKITLPTAFSDTTLPILRDDPVLSSGSLFLFDPAHPVYPAAAGIGANGSAVPNLAWKDAAPLLGIASPTKDSAAGVVTYSVGGQITPTGGAKGKFERTGKGGFHGIVSQANALNQNADTAGVVWPTSVKDYLAANQSHDFYVSTWLRFTRLATGTRGTARHGLIDTSTGSFFAGLGVLMTNDNQDLQGPSGGPTGKHTTGLDALGAPAYAAWSGPTTKPSGASSGASGGAGWGPSGNISYAFFPNANQHWASWILYRLYLEDLTVSGRTFAQVDALDFAAYTAAFAAGGRYNGDTFTNPTTIP